MKQKFTLSAVLILVTVVGFSQCPSFFRRNNGNGTCGGQSSEMRLYFPTCPVTPLSMDSIYINGVKANVTIGSPDASNCSKSGYVSYCFTGNLPPANSLQVFFTYASGGG